MNSGIGAIVAVGVNVGVGIGVFVDVAVGTIVSVGVGDGDGVTETPHAERKNITKIEDKIFFKPNLLFTFKTLCLEGCAN